MAAHCGCGAAITEDVAQTVLVVPARQTASQRQVSRRDERRARRSTKRSAARERRSARRARIHALKVVRALVPPGQR